MKLGRFLKKAGFLVLVLLIALYSVFPFYWAIVTSLKSGSALFTVELFPFAPAWKNYTAIFVEQPFGRSIWNSLLVATATVMVSLGVGTLAAYALARKTFTGKHMILICFLSISMFPQIAILAGMFELVRALGVYNHLAGLVIADLVLTLPMTVWILTTFMREIPKEIEEAAVIDGAGDGTILIRIFLPLLAPSLVTSGLLAFIVAWNEFLFALTFTLSDRSRTIPVAISQMSGASQHELPWGNIMAASVTVTLPLVLLALVFQRRIVSGLTAGSVKG